MRYLIRRDALGWTVVDAMTRQVAYRGNVTLTGLALQEADFWADAMSWLHREENRPQNGR